MVCGVCDVCGVVCVCVCLYVYVYAYVVCASVCHTG